MKKIVSVLLACVLLFTCASVFAENEMYVFTQQNITVTYNGETLVFPDAQPMMQNGRTLVPVRTIMERADLFVDYNGETKAITATREDLTISMTLDDKSATIKKGDEVRTVTLDVPPTLIGGRTYVPVRFISESVDIKVNWNPLYNEVVLIDPRDWKKEIAENAKLLNLLLDTPLANGIGRAGNASGNLLLGYIFKNLASDTGLAPQTTACLDFYISATDVYDGTNFASYAMIDADLSALKTMYAGNNHPDDAPSSDFAKKHRIELDMIMDNEWNVYIRCNGLFELMKVATGNSIGDLVGDRYIKFSLSDILGRKFPEMSSCKTYWDLFASFATADDMMYTQSVALLDDMVDAYIEKYHNNSLKINERYDGTYLWSLTMYQDDIANFSDDMAHFSAIITGTPIADEETFDQSSELKNSKIKQTISVLVDNNALVKIEVNYSSESDEQIIAGSEGTTKAPTVKETHKANFGASTRKFNSYKDNKVSIPKNVIPIDELKQLQ